MPNVYCKCCGAKYSSVQSLTSGSCSKSPSRRHVLYSGNEQVHYYCEYCGSRYSTIQSLTSGSCSKSPTGKHIPYEGDEKSQYSCEYCGSKYSSIQSLTSIRETDFSLFTSLKEYLSGEPEYLTSLRPTCCGE